MSPLLAQRMAQQNNEPPDEFLFVVLAGVCGFYLVLFVVFIFFLLTLQRALARCRPECRTMEPGQVWLNLIPLFNIAWMFITVLRISESLRNEFYERGRSRRGDDYGQGLGIVTIPPILCVANCAPLEGPSTGWAIAGGVLLVAGVLALIYTLRRRRGLS